MILAMLPLYCATGVIQSSALNGLIWTERLQETSLVSQQNSWILKAVYDNNDAFSKSSNYTGYND